MAYSASVAEEQKRAADAVRRRMAETERELADAERRAAAAAAAEIEKTSKIKHIQRCIENRYEF